MSLRRLGQRIGVRPDRIEEYERLHAAPWPGVLEQIRRSNIRNYTIFRDGDRMFGYFEADDLAAAGRYLAQQDVSTRWQDAMAELLESRVPDGGPPALDEIFRLE